MFLLQKPLYLLFFNYYTCNIFTIFILILQSSLFGAHQMLFLTPLSSLLWPSHRMLMRLYNQLRGTSVQIYKKKKKRKRTIVIKLLACLIYYFCRRFHLLSDCMTCNHALIPLTSASSLLQRAQAYSTVDLKSCLFYPVG